MIDKFNIPWSRRYSIWSYIKSSLWVVPVLALIAAFLLKRLSELIGRWTVEEGYFYSKAGFLALNAAEAHALLDRVFTLTLTCLVFTFSSLLVAIQVASGQYTPRIIATTLLRDNTIRSIVGLFILTMLWAHRTMVQLGNLANVPQLQVFLASVFALASVIAFIVLIDYAAKFLRPVSLVNRVAERGIEVILSVYPGLTGTVPERASTVGKRILWPLHFQTHRTAAPAQPVSKRDVPERVIYHAGRSGTVLAVNMAGLVAQAQRADSVIEVVPQVGDFVAVDEPLFYLYGKDSAIDDHTLRSLVAFGSERTMEQDPMFAFRIEVDIALKALSAAINDPTTAVLAIDQLQRLLRLVGQRSLNNHEILDNAGKPRVVLHTPNWEDFVHITFRELRQCGAGSLQIARRLRAMAVNLIETLPEHRHPALREELDLLERAVAQQHTFPEDLALASIPDSQGLGGAAHP